MTSTLPHITVCVCTFRRQRLLRRLLTALGKQLTTGAFQFSVKVVDNDASGSACRTVDACRSSTPVLLDYNIEPVQNIALARNRAVNSSTGDLVAFIDDDEIPGEDWLVQLFDFRLRTGADGVLGPVLPRFEVQPPAWAVKSKLFDRPSHPSGHVLSWTESRTGNVLLTRAALQGIPGPFREQLGSGGEDRDFFKRSIETGRRFVWCNAAPVYEFIPAHRLRRSVQIRRALLRGKASLAADFSASSVAKSCIAVTMYTLVLPVLCIVGDHVFMRYLIKDCDHMGRLLSLCHLNPVSETYITE